jgi:hypothetical protein
MKDPNLLVLEQAVAQHPDGLSLGDLRREFSLDPIVTLKLVRNHPDLFHEYEGSQCGHPTTFITHSTLEPMVKTFIGIVRASGASGISAARLWQKRSYSSKETLSIAQQFPEHIEIRKIERKTFYHWKTQPAPPAPLPHTQDKISELKDKLLTLCQDGTRDSLFLEKQLGIPQADIKLVLDAYPDLFVATPNNLGNTPATQSLLISLPAPITPPALQDAPESRPEASTAASAASPPALLSEIFSPQELEILKFRPPSASMSSRRRGTVIKGSRHRERKPLVTL